MQNPVTTQTPAPAQAIQTKAEGEALITQVATLLSALIETVEVETALVRKGRIVQASRIGPKKAELAGQYYAFTERLKANVAFLRANLPRQLDQLRQLHDAFRAVLQVNLTVVATAHAVSEGIIRGVAGEITRKNSPQTYGLSGRPTAPATQAARPVTLVRSL